MYLKKAKAISNKNLLQG